MTDKIGDNWNKEMDIFLSDTIHRGVALQDIISKHIGIETTQEIIAFSYTFWFEFVKHLMGDVLNINEGFAAEEEAREADENKVK